MFNRISPVVLAGLLFAVLVGSSSHISVFIAALLVLMAATFLINLKRIGLSWPHLLLPILYLLGVGAIFVIVKSPTIRVLFLILSAVVFYFLENNLGHESHFLQNTYLFSVFAIYLGIFALEFYLHFSTPVIVMFVFVMTYLMIIQGFAGFSLPAKKYFYLLAALTMAECAWGLTLWPTYYSVKAVTLFSFYYLLWIFSFSAFFGKLTLKKVYLQLTLVVFVLAVTLSSAAWKPLIK